MNPQDIFDLNTALGKLSVLGLSLFFAIVSNYAWVRGWILPPSRVAVAREIFDATNARADRNLTGWEAATEQFERSLDLIEKMQDRKRRVTDEVR